MFESRTFDIVVYPDSYDCEHLADICRKYEYIKDWAYCMHDKDNQKTHYHIMIQTYETQSSARISKDFGVGENYIEKAQTKKKTHKYDNMCLYLIHRNAPEKYQYNVDDVTASFDYKAFIEKHENKEKKTNRRNEIIDLIHAGTIKEYNITEFVTAREYVQYSSAIKSAFAYREKLQTSVKRNMQVIYISGKAGCGKTTYAKERAEALGYDCFISSASNDLFYGYGGQPCIILDDLRGSMMSYADILKLLDNNTNTTAKARYNNKNLADVKLLIITSSQSIEEFYHDVFDNNGESILQLKRRIGTYVNMDKDYIYVSVWDNRIKSYSKEKKFRNNILLRFPDNDIDIDSALAILGISAEEEITEKNEFVTLTPEEEKQVKLLFG